ncbi:UNVERIFIED_CONTAM: hypothetical protein GTU68_044892 [Idotea baltica]|nr:hypothetical protein [Idotea baltica]
MTDIQTQIKSIQAEIADYTITDANTLEQFRIAFLGSKNKIKDIFKEIKNVAPDQRKSVGQEINQLKVSAEEKYASHQNDLKKSNSGPESHNLDLSAPGYATSLGSRHPIRIVMNRLVQIFKQIGFAVAEEREIEDDWHNFTAMNTPEDHPARDMQDTFYLKNSMTDLLRTHTSSVQSRTMENQQPPIRIIAPGRVYRNETVSARSHCQFHQIEGLYIDKGVSFADMKQTLFYYARAMYGQDVKLRLRPSFFPFTEPKTEDDYRITKGTGWLEVLGCGMVDPNVLTNCGIDAQTYTGFAFGMGIERQAMLAYKVNDIRLFFENDVRFLKQFIPEH